MKKVGIVTVNFNGSSDTLELLQSFKSLNTENLEVKILVVDNGSLDDSVEIISQKFPSVDILQTGENLGFSGGYNRGLQYLLEWGAEYFLVINNDTIIGSQDLLQELVSTMDSKDHIGMVAPKIYFAPGFEFLKEKYSKEEKGRVIWYGGGSFDWNNVMSTHFGIDQVDVGQCDLVKEVDFISGCCFLVSRQVLVAVGLFDEKMFAYFEDSDFCQRVRSAGYKLFYSGEVYLYHKVSQTSGTGSDKTDYYLTRNRLIFGSRYASGRTKFALLRQSIGFIFTGRKFQKKGVWDFLTNKFGPLESVQKTNDVKYSRSLSVIVLHFNTPDLLKNLLISLFDQKSGLDEQNAEVVVIDNASSVNPESWIKKEFPKVKFIGNTKNGGFAKGNNQGIRYSLGENILLLNSDIEVLENGISHLIQGLQEFHGKVALGGRLFFPDLSPQGSCYNLPTLWGAFKEYVLGIKGSFEKYYPETEKPQRVEGVIMACMLIPKKIINEIGNLDEGTFAYFEDLEYCRRLKKNNIPVVYYPQARFIHVNGGSFSKLPSGKAYEQLRKSSVYYHGNLYYLLLTAELYLAQKLFRK